ncbi:MAG TPA: hypothetical protein VNO30_05510 [Kofleriaceae bacterium]|nr:hypothetical protein [Kofleriaceae bacterium]
MSIELRDRFFALSTGIARAEEIARYRAEVDAIDPEPAAVLDGLGIAWHPSARHKAVRFVDAERIDLGVRELFARPSEAAPHLAAVFVDPRELSFRTFENIVPLDRLFEGSPLEIALADKRKLATNAYAFGLRVSAGTRARLARLDELGLYVPPLNAASRGGERFIFHSALLAEALTAAVREAMPRSLLGGFSHVNPVFRCNRFEPGDAKFYRHHDTPYYDAARKQVSRYTILIYLTGGSAQPALDLGGKAALDTIEALSCVIFEQKYEHEGAPYQDGRKVFLRTELVFTDPELEHDPAIAARFSQAVYWTGESVFAPELARHADAYYNQVAAAHWGDALASTAGGAREPFVHKEFRGVHFVANGHDFWFGKQDGLSLTECAAITLLDYFNAKLGDTAFRAQCRTQIIEGKDAAWIPAFLEGKRGASASATPAVPAVPAIDKAALFPEPEQPDGVCCPFHGWGQFDATRHSEIIDLYTRAQSFAKAHIMPAPLVMMGQDVLLDPDKFVIEGNRIHVLGKEELAPVNFAACWNSGGSPDNYIDVAARVGVLHLLVPPILFTEAAGCYHLQFDFFRNSWMQKRQEATIPVPMIRNLDDVDPDDLPEDDAQPWMDAVDPALVTRGKGRRAKTLWWADGSPLIDELYDAIADREAASDDDDDDDDDE